MAFEVELADVMISNCDAQGIPVPDQLSKIHIAQSLQMLVEEFGNILRIVLEVIL